PHLSEDRFVVICNVVAAFQSQVNSVPEGMPNASAYAGDRVVPSRLKRRICDLAKRLCSNHRAFCRSVGQAHAEHGICLISRCAALTKFNPAVYRKRDLLRRSVSCANQSLLEWFVLRVLHFETAKSSA